MSDIAPIGRTNAAGLNPINRANQSASKAGAGRSRGNDSVQLSTVAQMLSKLNQMPDVRQNLVNQVRSQIQAGTYETPAKINAAVQGLLQDLSGHNGP